MAGAINMRWIYLAVAAAMAGEAGAHEASNIAGQPTGWKYPWLCCSDSDCQPVPASQVHELPEGIVIDGSTDKAPIAYGDSRRKDSPDGDYHWCSHKQGAHVGETICIFTPPKGF